MPYFDDFGQIGERAARNPETGETYYVPDNITYKEWEKNFVKSKPDNIDFMANYINNWNGSEKPIKHTTAELKDLKKYAEEHGIELYQRQPYDGDISLLKSEINVIEKIRSDFHITEPLRLGWKEMNVNDFVETSANHQEIWINRLALRNRNVTEKNLSADNFLAVNLAEGIAAHEMGHVISGKLKKGVTGLDIYKQTIYNITKEAISDDDALELLFTKVSNYSINKEFKQNGKIFYNEIISELLSVHYTTPNKYTSEFVRLLKEAFKK